MKKILLSASFLCICLLISSPTWASYYSGYVPFLKPIPAPPSVSVPSTDADGSYRVNWTVRTNAYRYDVSVKVNNGSYARIYSGSSTSIAQQRTPGTYSYIVRACSFRGCSRYSTPKSVRVASPPPKVTVRWQPNNLNLGEATSLIWSAQNVASCIDSKGVEYVNTNSRFYARRTSPWAYRPTREGSINLRLTCIGKDGSRVSATATGHVRPRLPAHVGFSENYRALLKTTNGTTIALTKNTGSVPSVGDIELVWNSSSKTYSPQILRSTSGSWRSVSIKPVLEDFNVDGFTDILLKNMNSAVPAIPNLLDQIVFANPKRGQAPLTVTALDEKFQMFFRDMYKWMGNRNYFDAAFKSIAMPSYKYYIIYDYYFCFRGFRTRFFSFPTCYRNTAVLRSIEYTLTSTTVNTQLPYLSDPNFVKLAGKLLQSSFESRYSISLAPYESGEISGCKFYCGRNYGWYYSGRVYDLFVPSTKTTKVFDRENYNLDALNVATVLAHILDGTYSDQTDHWRVFAEAAANIMGVPLFGFNFGGERDNTPYKKGAMDESDEANALIRHWIYIAWKINSATNENDNSIPPPETWQKHEYNFKTTICSTDKDTVFYEYIYRGTTLPEEIITLTIPANVCTLQNVFCWSKKNPAPRKNTLNQKTAKHGKSEELIGSNRVITWIDENGYTHINETQEGHILHDSLAKPNCANLKGGLKDISTIPDRCSYVQRKVQHSIARPSDIEIFTHGAGYNSPPIMSEINKVFGRGIFKNTDSWIRNRLAKKGTCTDDPS
ncbi:MAG: hypothetical protein GDA55_04545 [Cellvibrionales bacterium]|nr:hypothetical protein [Cellvibrionales bacterium]